MVPVISADPIELIRHNLRLAADSLKAAADVYCQELRNDPNFGDLLREAIPELTKAFLAGLEKVGNGSLDARVLYDGCPAPALVATLPPSEQRKIIEQMLPIANEAGDSRMVWYRDLSVYEARQVISRGGVRSVQEQVAYIKGIRFASDKKSMDKSRHIRTESQETAAIEIDTKRGRVKIIRPPVTLSVKDLKAIIKEIESV